MHHGVKGIRSIQKVITYLGKGINFSCPHHFCSTSESRKRIVNGFQKFPIAYRQAIVGNIDETKILY